MILDLVRHPRRFRVLYCLCGLLDREVINTDMADTILFLEGIHHPDRLLVIDIVVW
jgi:hypothetical protein